MTEIFIAALLVLAILTLALFFVIRKCVLRLNEKVKQDFFAQLGAYDEHIEQKSRELQELKEELLRLQEEEPSLAAELGDSGGHYLVLEGSSASYVNMDFYRAYAKVQSEFKDMAYEGMCRRVAQLCQERRDLAVHEYREIQGIFSRELQYQMVTLPPDAQREIMATIAKNSVAKKRILDAYSREHTVFNFKEFMEFIREYIVRHEATVYVYSQTGEPCIEGAPKQVLFCRREDITEGYIVQYQDRVYDYSL